ncbi:hypothetical protein ETW24_00950 [Leisingera sp. NJS204]|nr:hypothetical protein ETW24_00950 [Leisingera sp. NJS204]
MSEIITVGLDLGQNVFQVHGTNAAGQPVPRKKLEAERPLKPRKPKLEAGGRFGRSTWQCCVKSTAAVRARSIRPSPPRQARAGP